MELCELSLPLAVSSGDRKLEARAIMVMGRVYQTTAPARALRHFDQSMAISRETKDRATEAWCMLYLSETYHALHDSKVVYMAEGALTIAKDLALVSLKCKALLILGVHYSDAGEYITAIGISHSLIFFSPPP
jgi:hypothetical protein